MSCEISQLRAFADAWARKEIVQAPLAQLPWYHHLALLECLKSRGDRIAYAALAIENGWSRNVMVHQIELGVADLHGTAITNFKKLMPPTDSDMAEQTLRGEYVLGFLPANAKTKENKLRAMLVDKVAKFMVELGAGFSYVGKGLTINVGGDEFEIDLLFYHVVLPNIKPAVLTVFIFQFVNIWNGLSKELVYDEQLKVVKVALEQISASNLYARMGSGMAGSVLLMIPPIVIFILMQRNVVETMTFAGMKEG